MDKLGFKVGDKLKAKRDKLRQDADKAHTAYIDFCKANGVPVHKGRPKGSKNKTKQEGVTQ